MARPMTDTFNTTVIRVRSAYADKLRAQARHDSVPLFRITKDAINMFLSDNPDDQIIAKCEAELGVDCAPKEYTTLNIHKSDWSGLRIRSIEKRWEVSKAMEKAIAYYLNKIR